MGALLCHHAIDESDLAPRTSNLRRSRHLQRSVESISRGRKLTLLESGIKRTRDLKQRTEEKRRDASTSTSLPRSAAVSSKKSTPQSSGGSSKSIARRKYESSTRGNNLERIELEKLDENDSVKSFAFKRCTWYGQTAKNIPRDRGDFAVGVVRQVESKTLPAYGKKRDWYSEINGGNNRKESFAFKSSAWFGGAGSVKGLVRHYEAQYASRAPEPQFEALPVREHKSMSQLGDNTQRLRLNMDQRPSAPVLSSATDSNSGSSKKEFKFQKPVGREIVPSAPERPSVFSFENIPPPPEFSVGYAIPTAPPLTAAIPSAPPAPPPPPPLVVRSISSLRFPPPPSSWLDTIQESSTQSPEDDDSSPLPNSDSLSPPELPKIRPPAIVHRVDNARETYFMAAGEGSSTGFFHTKPTPSRSISTKDYAAVEQAVGRIAERLKQTRTIVEPTNVVTEKRYRAVLNGSFDRTISPLPVEVNVDHFRNSPDFNKVIDECDRSFVEYHRQLSAILKEGDQGVTYSNFEIPSPPVIRHQERVPPFIRHQESVPPVIRHQEPVACNKKPPVVASTPQPMLVPSKAGHRKSADSELGGTKKTLQFDSGSVSSDTTGDSMGIRKRSAKELDEWDSAFDGRTTRGKRAEVNLKTNSQRGFEFKSTISLRTSDLSRYTVTQTKKELRTGKKVTKRREVYGSGVTQCVIFGNGRRDGRYNEDSFDDTLQSVSYDYETEESEYH